MVIFNDYQIKIDINESKDIISNQIFMGFRINSLYVNNTYYCELYLFEEHIRFLCGSGINVGDNVKVTITIEDKEYVYDLFVFRKKFYKSGINVILFPKFYYDLFIKKNTIIEYNTAMNIIEKIIKNLNLKSDIEKSFLNDKKYYYFIEMTYIDMIRALIDNIKGNNANYCFFIDKDNIFRLYTIKKIMNKKSLSSFSDTALMVFQGEDLKLNVNRKNGIGCKYCYFDWSSGEFKVNKMMLKDFNLDNETVNKKFYIPDIIKDIEYNNVVNCNTIGIDKYYYTENLIKNKIEYDLLRKNYFSLFLDFNTISNFNINPLDIVDIDLVMTEVGFNGKWIVYNIVDSFEENTLNNKITVTNPYYIEEK